MVQRSVRSKWIVLLPIQITGWWVWTWLVTKNAGLPIFSKQNLTERVTAGLKITAHAGEFAGADSIRETIKHLQPQRLGHAVRAVDDPHLMDEIAEKGIAIECCPTSNYLTASIPSLKDHPLPVFLKHGIKATLNTDDPAFMGNLTIQKEYQNAKEQMGLSRKELELVQANGLEVSFPF